MTAFEEKKLSHVLANTVKKLYTERQRGMLGMTTAEVEAEYAKGFMSSERYEALMKTATGGSVSTPSGGADNDDGIYGGSASEQNWDNTPAEKAAQAAWVARGGTPIAEPRLYFGTLAPAKDTSGANKNTALTSMTDSLSGLLTNKTVNADFSLSPSIPTISFPQQQQAAKTPWTTILLIGGGVLAAGALGFFLLRKK